MQFSPSDFLISNNFLNISILHHVILRSGQFVSSVFNDRCEIDFVKMDKENFAELKNGLNEREKLILDMKYNGKPYAEIGKKINRTMERARQITFMTLDKLKKAGGF